MLSAALIPKLAGLEFSDNVPSDVSHEIHGVSRGLGVYYHGQCIVGEGIGIGAPLALFKNRAVFPLHAERAQLGGSLVKRYHLNGLSDKYIGKGRADFPYKWVRSKLAPLYRKSPRFRPLFHYLMAVRTVVGIRSRYRRVDAVGRVRITYHYDDHQVKVDVDASDLAGTKFLVANELDGQIFRHLSIDGHVHISRIPPWLEIEGRKASISSPDLGLSFSLAKVPGCRLFAGREVLGRRLNWAGFSYLPEPDVTRFSYEVVFEKND